MQQLDTKTGGAEYSKSHISNTIDLRQLHEMSAIYRI